MSEINSDFFYLCIACIILVIYVIWTLKETKKQFEMRGSNMYTKCTKRIEAVYEDYLVEERKVRYARSVHDHYSKRYFFSPIMRYTYDGVEYYTYSLQQLETGEFTQKHYSIGEKYYIFIDVDNPSNFVINIVKEYGLGVVIKDFLLRIAIIPLVMLVIF